MTTSPQRKFLLRAVGCLAIALALWWMLLMDSLMGGLRLSTELMMHLFPGDGSVAHATIGEDGNWLLQMPVPVFVQRLDSVQKQFGRASKDAPPVKFRSLKLTLPGSYAVLFSVSLPFFWAIWVAAPGGGNFLRGLVAGSALLLMAAVLSILFFGICTALKVLHLFPSGASGFLLTSGEYVATNVIPYAAPVLLALWLNDGLQSMVFSVVAKKSIPETRGRKVGAVRARGGRA